MKSVAKICLLVLLVISTFTVMAQEESDWSALSSLKGYQTMLLSVDFSDAVVNYMSLDEFKFEESDWDEGVRNMQRRMANAFNAKVYNGPETLRLVTQGEAPVTMTVKVLQLTSSHVSNKKTYILTVVIISDKQGKELFRKSMNAEQGVFGTRLNLFGDVFEQLGADFGKYCVKFIR